MKVFKFGGASVSDEEAIRNLGSIVQTFGTERMVLVVSAMGKTTNALEEVVNGFFYERRDMLSALQAIKEQHLQVATHLRLDSLLDNGTLNDLFVEAEWLLEDEIEDTYDYIYDQVVAIGELLSTRLVHAYLQSQGVNANWIDARDVIKTDDTYRSGKLDWDRTRMKVQHHIQPCLEASQIVVLAGFIGSTLENNTITLGREGSDYTGAILASILEAESLTVWKDVPGIMTADPHLFSDAKLLAEVDYKEAIEMTFYGAKVIHPKTIKPLMDQKIPLLVRSFTQPGVNGTVVSHFPHVKYPTIRVRLDHQTLLQLFTLDFTFIMEDHLSEVFRLAVVHGIKIQMMENLALNLSLVVQSEREHIQAFCADLLRDFEVVRCDGLQLYTIRHFDEDTVSEVKENRQIYIEEYNATTAQILVGQ